MSFIKAILKKVENQTFAGQQWLTFIFLLLKSMWTSNCLVTQILENIFYVQHKKEINTGLGQHVSEEIKF